jgi:SnoaL-like domain
MGSATYADEIRQIREELRHLRDRQDILDCVNRYGRGLDRLDAALIESAYHADAIDNHGPFVGPVLEFVNFAIDVEGQFQWTHHGISSHNCEIDGDTAHAESYVHWFVRMPDGKTLGAGGGRYLDKLERRDGRWRIVLRRLLMDWSFEVPYSGWLGPDWENVRGSRDTNDPSYDRPLRLPQALQAALAAKNEPSPR